MITTLVDQDYTGPGEYTVTFNAEKFAAGVYYARLQNGATQQVRAMLKVK